MKNKLKNIGKLFIALALGLITVLSAAAQPVNALGFNFKLLGKDIHIGTDGVHAQDMNQYENQNLYQNSYQHQEQNQITEQATYGLSHQQNTGAEYEQVDIIQAIERVNQDEGAKEVMASFSGNQFCGETERRIAYISVADDGSLELLDEEPFKCYKIKTTEQYLSSLWERVQDGQEVPVSEVSDNVKMPFAVKAKLYFKGIRLS